MYLHETLKGQEVFDIALNIEQLSNCHIFRKFLCQKVKSRQGVFQIKPN